MPATLTYNPSPLQNPAGILRADPCDPRRYLAAPSTAPCPVQPLKGLRRTRAAVSYRVFAPVGANLPFTIEGNPSVSPTIVHCSLYIVHCPSHTFSAKEKDSETGLSYFGSRYYSSDLSIWLSVDPMSDKHPNQSNYVYCGNNPLIIIDPNGEDEWEVNKSGHLRHVDGSEGTPDKLFVVKGFGKNNFKKRTEVEGLDVDAELMNGLLDSEDGGKIVYSQTGRSDEMEKMFNYLADNTNVEWALATVDHYDGTGLTPERKDFLITNHSRTTCEEAATLSANYSSYGGLIRLKHSHPAYYSLIHLLDNSSLSKPSGNPQGTRDNDGDYGHKRRCTKPENSPNAIFILRHRGHEQRY